MARGFKVWTDFRVGRNDVNKAIHKNIRAFGSLSKAGRALGSVFSGVLGANVATIGLMKVSMGIRAVTTDFIDLDHAITAAGSRFGPAFYRGTEGARQLSDAVREVASTTEFKPAEVALGLKEYAKAGLSAAGSMRLLAGTAKLATNAEVDFASAASISLDALDAFNLRSKDAAKTEANLIKVNDTLTKVVNSAKLDFEDFAETLKYAGPVAEATGADLKDMAVLTGLVAKAGIRGSLAGTTLKNAYLGLAAPVGKGKTALKKLGIQISNNDGSMRNTLDILIDFKKATADMGQTQRIAATNVVFGRRAIAGMSKILSLGTDDLLEYQEGMKKTSGVADEMAKEMRGSIQNRIAKIESMATELSIQLFNAFGPKIDKAIASTSKWLEDVDMEPIIEGVTEAVSVLGDLAKMFWENREMILAAAKSFLIFKAGMVAMNIADSIIGLAGLARGFGGVGTAASKAGTEVEGLSGKVGMIGPALLAAAAGFSFGDFIATSMGLKDFSTTKDQSASNRATKQAVKLGRGGAGVSDKDLDTMEKQAMMTLGIDDNEQLKKQLMAGIKNIKGDVGDEVLGAGFITDAKRAEQDTLRILRDITAEKRRREDSAKAESNIREFRSGLSQFTSGQMGSTKNIDQFSKQGQSGFLSESRAERDLRVTENMDRFSTQKPDFMNQTPQAKEVVQREEMVQTVDWGNVPDFITIGEPQTVGNPAGSMP